MTARLQFGPFDGHDGEVVEPLPLALDVTHCHGCGCGRPVHYRIANFEDAPARNYYRYELIEITATGAVYRHADTLDPATERKIAEALTQ